MYRRSIKAKTTNINHELIIDALIEDGEPVHLLLTDDIHLYQDSNGENFASLETAFRKLNIPYDCYYASDNDNEHISLHSSFRPEAKNRIFIYSLGNCPSECKELTEC